MPCRPCVRSCSIGWPLRSKQCLKPAQSNRPSAYELIDPTQNGDDWVNMGAKGATAGIGTLTADNFCTSDGSVINCTTDAINLTTDVTGTVQAAQFPALSGDVTTSAGSLATVIGRGYAPIQLTIKGS